MDRIQRRVVVGGLILILAGFIYGGVYTVLVDRTSLLQIKDSYSSVFLIVAEKSEAKNAADILLQLGQLQDLRVRYTRAIGAHVHAINLGLVVILAGLLLPLTRLTPDKGRWLATLFLGGGAIYPIGLSLQAGGYLFVGEVFAVLGSGSMVVATGLFLLSLLLVRSVNSRC